MKRLTEAEYRRDAFLSIPELADGFDRSGGGKRPGMQPVTYIEKVEGNGTYMVRIRVKAAKSMEQLFIFAGRKKIVYAGPLPAGQVLECETILHLSEIIPRYHDQPFRQSYVSVSFAGREIEALTITCPEVKQLKKRGAVIFLAGDSTVTDQSCQVPYRPEACYSSWGQNLQLYVGGRYGVDNQAHSGLTTESFRREGHYEIVRKYLQPGDYCLFQFGHNDQKLPLLQAASGYRENLRAYVREVRELGGNPVLVTPLARNTWYEDGSYRDLLKEYAKTVIEIGMLDQVPVIDLHEASVRVIKDRGKDGSQVLFHPGDMTHTNEYGSLLFAEVIADGLGCILPDGKDIMAGKLKVDLLPAKAGAEEGAEEADRKPHRAEEKEQFHQMEKSAAELFRIVEQAKQQAAEMADREARQSIEF